MLRVLRSTVFCPAGILLDTVSKPLGRYTFPASNITYSTAPGEPIPMRIMKGRVISACGFIPATSAGSHYCKRSPRFNLLSILDIARLFTNACMAAVMEECPHLALVTLRVPVHEPSERRASAVS